MKLHADPEFVSDWYDTLISKLDRVVYFSELLYAVEKLFHKSFGFWPELSCINTKWSSHKSGRDKSTEWTWLSEMPPVWGIVPSTKGDCDEGCD